MSPIRITVAQSPKAADKASGGCHLKVQYGSTETLCEVAADTVQELLQMNKSIKWYMEEFVIHLPFQEPRAQDISASLVRYAGLLVEALRLDIGVSDHDTLHLIIQIKEDTIAIPTDSIDIGTLRWEVLQNVALWPDEAKPASVSVVRVWGNPAEKVPLISTSNTGATSTFNILALTARPRFVDDIPHRLITKSIYDVVNKANVEAEFSSGSTVASRATLTIVRPGSLDALKRELRSKQRYDVVHLDLHGKVENHEAFALFIDEIHRDAHFVAAKDLASLLSSHGVRTVFLNACQSAVEGEGSAANLAKALIQYGIQTVVAMAYKVLDITADAFFYTLYDQLLRFSRNPLLAVQAARQSLLYNRTKKTRYLTSVILDDYLVPSVYVREDDGTYVTSGLSLSDLETLRENAPELPPDKAVGIDVNLVGREGDLLMLETDLMLESCVTAIEGPPGIGKSALINSAAEWWKSTGFINRVLRVDFDALQSPECLIELLNREFGTDLTMLDMQLEDADARGRCIRKKIKKFLAPAETKRRGGRRGGAKGNLPKTIMIKRETMGESKIPLQDSKTLLIFDGVEAYGPRKIAEPVLELMDYFLVVFRDAQVSLSVRDLDPAAEEPVAPNPYKSFAIITARCVPDIAVLNRPMQKYTETGPSTKQARKHVHTLTPLDENAALLFTRHTVEKSNRYPDAKDWEGLLVQGQLSKLVQGNPLALRILLRAFNSQPHNIIDFMQSLLRGDRIRLGSISSEMNHDASDSLPNMAQAVDDARQLLHFGERNSEAVRAFYPFWAPFQLQTVKDYLSYIDLVCHNNKRVSIDRCAAFGEQELELLYRKNKELDDSNSDLAMKLLQPFIDQGFAVLGKAIDGQVKSESDYVTLHPLIPLLLRDESGFTDDALCMARETAHEVMPKLFRYRIKKWPLRSAYWKKEWDSAREILRWEFFDFLGATYRALNMRSSILTINIIIELAHATKKGLFWDAGRRPLMAGFCQTAADSMYRDGHDIYDAPNRPDFVPLITSLQRLMGNTRVVGGAAIVRRLAAMQAKFLRLQHVLSAELAEMTFCMELIDYNTRVNEEAARKWFERLKKTYRGRTKVPGAEFQIQLMFDDLLKIMEASNAAPNPNQNLSGEQMAAKANARTTVYKNLARTGFDISGYDGGAWKAVALRDEEGDSDDDDNDSSRGMLGLKNSNLGHDEGVFVAILLARRKMEERPPNIAAARRLLYKAFSNDLQVSESPANAAYIHRALSEIVEEKAAKSVQAQATNEESHRDYWRRALYHWEQALQVESDAGFENSIQQIQTETKRTKMLREEIDRSEKAPESDPRTPIDPSSSRRVGKRSWNPLKDWAASRAERKAQKAAIATHTTSDIVVEVGNAQTTHTTRRAARSGKVAEYKVGGKIRGMIFRTRTHEQARTEARPKVEAEPNLTQLRVMALGSLDRRKADAAPELGLARTRPSRARRPPPSMSEEKMAEAKESFLLISENGEYITAADMAALCRSLDQQKSNQEIQEMIEEVDTTGRGVVDFEDFLTMEQAYEPSDTDQELREAFDVFDKNKDGFISHEELRHQMQLLGEELTNDEIAEMIREADINGDGKIDYHEFVHLMTR